MREDCIALGAHMGPYSGPRQGMERPYFGGSYHIGAHRRSLGHQPPESRLGLRFAVGDRLWCSGFGPRWPAKVESIEFEGPEAG